VDLKPLWAHSFRTPPCLLAATPPCASQVLERVWERGDIYKANYEGWYCVDCEEYKDEGDMDAGAESRG